jgi:hypothetical protein
LPKYFSAVTPAPFDSKTAAVMHPSTHQLRTVQRHLIEVADERPQSVDVRLQPTRPHNVGSLNCNVPRPVACCSSSVKCNRIETALTFLGRWLTLAKSAESCEAFFTARAGGIGSAARTGTVRSCEVQQPCGFQGSGSVIFRHSGGSAHQPGAAASGDFLPNFSPADRTLRAAPQHRPALMFPTGMIS